MVNATKFSQCRKASDKPNTSRFSHINLAVICRKRHNTRFVSRFFASILKTVIIQNALAAFEDTKT